MADAWGGSWGVSWGDSWGSGVVPPPPTPIAVDPDQGAGGLNVFDPSVILEYRKRIQKSQETHAARERRIKEEKEELSLLVHRAYNKALGIEEPEEVSPSIPSEMLDKAEEARIAREVRDRAQALGLQASLRQIAAIVRVRKAEAMAEAFRQDVAQRTQLLLAAEAEDDQRLDTMMEDAERLFNEAREMLK